MAQVNDISAAHVPRDSISSLSMNGTLEMPPTLLAVGSWDASVGFSSSESLSSTFLGILLFICERLWDNSESILAIKC